MAGWTVHTSAQGTVWNVGADYIYHLDEFSGPDGMFRPYLGAGLGYLDDGSAISMAEDGFTWNLQAGTEILFTEEISSRFGAKFLVCGRILQKLTLTWGLI